MNVYHGSFLSIEKPNLQICFRSQSVIDRYLKFEGSERL